MSLLDPIPGDEKRLVQAVVDIDDEIVVGNGVNIWTRKLAVDEYSRSKTRM